MCLSTSRRVWPCTYFGNVFTGWFPFDFCIQLMGIVSPLPLSTPKPGIPFLLDNFTFRSLPLLPARSNLHNVVKIHAMLSAANTPAADFDPVKRTLWTCTHYLMSYRRQLKGLFSYPFLDVGCPLMDGQATVCSVFCHCFMKGSLYAANQRHHSVSHSLSWTHVCLGLWVTFTITVPRQWKGI